MKFVATQLASAACADCQGLTSVPGIGPVTSSATVAAIGSGGAFGKGRDCTAWVAPKRAEFQSDATG
jgi:transposase